MDYELIGFFGRLTARVAVFFKRFGNSVQNTKKLQRGKIELEGTACASPKKIVSNLYKIVFAR